jgi:WD40 repeat protein
MNFVDTWREQATETLIKSAGIAATVRELDLEYALMAISLIWPLREPVQEFDIPAIEAAKMILGRRAKYILAIAQKLDDDLMQAARDLNTQLADDAELNAALNILIKYFKAFYIFTDELTRQQSQQAGSPEPAQSEAGSTMRISPARDASNITEAGETETTTTPTQPPRVFISYARSDGEELAREVRQRLEREGISVWQDRVKMEGGRDWWLQITEALNLVEFMVLVMTPAALKSEIVHKEWRYARQQGVCVYPIQGAANLNFAELPRWMRNVHFYNPKLEWSKLVTDLQQSCETPRVPFMVEDLADDFVARSGQLDKLLSLLLDSNGDPIPATIGLYGMGGYGKTILAKALCHHEEVRQAFDDGVLWVTLGENPGDLTGRVVDLVEVLSGERPGFAGLDAAESRLVQLLADRDILMVIDDVWNVAHLKPFMRGGARCARLITTRNFAALPPKAHSLEVGEMERNEATNLLKIGLPDAPLKPLRELADRLGEWPLLLKLANGTLRDRVYNNNQALSEALVYVNKALDKRGLTAFDAHNAAARDQAVSQTLGISQDLLTEAERQRYGELAIFPSDANIPLPVLEKLWGATAGLDDFDTEELCNRFCRLSLLSHFDPNSRYIAVHNIVRKYLAHEQRERLATLHSQFLNAYAAQYKLAAGQSGPVRWADLPHQESYLWTHLAYHLVGANRGAELAGLMKDLAYLAAKTYLLGAYTTEDDLLRARQAVPNDPVLTRLHQNFSQSSHLLNQGETLAEIANTLHSRLVEVAGLSELIAASEAHLPKPLLTASRRLPDLPEASLIRTLTGHGVTVSACAISADGSTIVSMAGDTILKIWDADTGAERFTLSSHELPGNSCAISNDGSVVASATWDGVLKIWDARTGVERLSIKADTQPLYRCALSGDGSMVVTASKDKLLKIWDTNTGVERRALVGHERSVTGCDISADGSTIVSTSSEGAINIWDANTGALRFTIGAYEAVETFNPAAHLTFTAVPSALLSCAISDDGSTIVAALPNSTLKVWDARTGEERCILEGHAGWIENCAISADGRLIVSASNDKTLRGWDGQTGAALFTLEGHNRAVTGCAVSADGRLVVSSSQDKTLKLWDAESGAEQSKLAGHSYTMAAQYCAVSADSRWVVFDSTDNTLRVVEVETGVERFVLKGHMRPITGCVISQDGTTLISSSQDRTLKIWDVQTGRERMTLRGHLWSVNDCALSRDGKIAISASEDSTLKVWDVATGSERLVLAGHVRGVNGCAISPDNRFIASVSADKTVKIWDAQTGALRFTMTSHAAPVNTCAISPDGLWAASGSNDETVKIWDSRTGQERWTLKGHTSPILGCVFSPDSHFILSVSKDKTIKLWAVESGQCLTSLRIDGAPSSCAWFPDGRHIFAVGTRGAYFLQLIKS